MNGQLLQNPGTQWSQPSGRMLHEFQQQGVRFDQRSYPASPARGGLLFELLREKQITEAAEIGGMPLLEAVSKEFVFQPEAPVKQFLDEHRSLSGILVESVPHLRACSGSECILSLRAPMDEVGSRTMYAIVQWSGSVEAVREALTKFDDTWWMTRSRQAAGYLTFTYELV